MTVDAEYSKRIACNENVAESVWSCQLIEDCQYKILDAHKRY